MTKQEFAQLGKKEEHVNNIAVNVLGITYDFANWKIRSYCWEESSRKFSHKLEIVVILSNAKERFFEINANSVEKALEELAYKLEGEWDKEEQNWYKF